VENREKFCYIENGFITCDQFCCTMIVTCIPQAMTRRASLLNAI
jgi:hypothetical protein